MAKGSISIVHFHVQPHSPTLYILVTRTTRLSESLCLPVSLSDEVVEERNVALLGKTRK